MKIKEILFEYNIEFLKNTYSDTYDKFIQNDRYNPHSSLEDFIKSIEMRSKENKTFQFIDPYMKWIVNLYVKGNLGSYKNIDETLKLIVTYDALKRKNKLQKDHKDINKIKTLANLKEIVQSYDEEESLSEKGLEKKFYETGEAILLYDGPDFKVVIPRSERASCFFGRNTKWCTAATKSKNKFNEYAAKSDLYTVIVKKTNERYQIFFYGDKTEIKDDKDISINFEEFYKKHPDVYHFFEPIATKHGSYLFRDPQRITKKEILNIIKDSKKTNNYLLDTYILLLLNNNPKLLDDPDILKAVVENEKLFDIAYKHGKMTDEQLENLLVNNYDALLLAIRELPHNPLLKKEKTYIENIKNTGKVSSLYLNDVRRMLSKNFIQKLPEKYKDQAVKIIIDAEFTKGKFNKNIIISALKYLESLDKNNNSLDYYIKAGYIQNFLNNAKNTNDREIIELANRVEEKLL